MQQHTDMPAGRRSTQAAATKILIIEDDVLVRDFVAAALSSAGYTTTVARDGREGIAAFTREAPALVITDIVMPDTEGIETILELRRLSADVLIIAISGGNRDFLAMAVKLGASAVLAKPFRPVELLDLVARLLQERDRMSA